MARLAYLYVPRITVADAREVFLVLQHYGFQVSHIGKTDPPKKRAVSFEEAAELVTRSAGGGSNYTFVRNREATFDLTFEIRNDSRWGFSTISLSFPEGVPERELCEALFRRLGAFVCISGEEGASKTQKWVTRLISQDCPDRLITAIGGDG